MSAQLNSFLDGKLKKLMEGGGEREGTVEGGKDLGAKLAGPPSKERVVRSLKGTKANATDKSDPKQETLRTAVMQAFRRHKNMVPRVQQLRTISRILKDVSSHKHEDKIRNYLVQHPAGSGKSLTIACLVLCLHHMKNAANRRGFDLVLILNDRKVLDAQLADTLIGFLGSNDVRNVYQCQSSAHLEGLLQAGKGIIITTVQKFVQLSPGKYFDKKRIAIIADEAHRTHGSASTEKLHSFLSGTSQQSKSITYFSFTCTPTSKTLEMFGISKGGKNIPFYSYSVSQGVEEKIILDVLEDYVTVIEPMLPPLEETGPLALVKRKSAYIVNHFVEKSVALSSEQYSPKGMVVVNGRQAILDFKRAIEEHINTLPQHKRFNVICVFSPFSTSEGSYAETDVKVNGKFANGNLVDLYKDPKSDVKLIIVAEKLQTGFDAPILGIMYVDKILKGATAVQTLGRLSRTTEGKKGVCVVDFQNTLEEMKAAFDEFVYPAEGKFSDEKDLDTAHKNNPIMCNLINDILGFSLSKETIDFKLSLLQPAQPETQSTKVNTMALKMLQDKSQKPSSNIKSPPESLYDTFDEPKKLVSGSGSRPRISPMPGLFSPKPLNTKGTPTTEPIKPTPPNSQTQLAEGRPTTLKSPPETEPGTDIPIYSNKENVDSASKSEPREDKDIKGPSTPLLIDSTTSFPPSSTSLGEELPAATVTPLFQGYPKKRPISLTTNPNLGFKPIAPQQKKPRTTPQTPQPPQTPPIPTTPPPQTQQNT